MNKGNKVCLLSSEKTKQTWKGSQFTFKMGWTVKTAVTFFLYKDIKLFSFYFTYIYVVYKKGFKRQTIY